MAVSVFPRSTFVDRVSFIAKTRFEAPSRTSRWVEKYTKRGFKIIGKDTESIQMANRLGPGRRKVGDGWCWSIPFESKFLRRLLVSESCS